MSTWTQRFAVAVERHRKRRAFARIRAHMAFFGVDVRDLTDEQIEESHRLAAEAIRQTGISAEEMARGFQRMAEVLAEYEGSR